MKIWNSYKKEMKIASRGFYFYMEIFVAVVLLAVLLFLVPEEPNTKAKEVIFMDMPRETYLALMDAEVDKGSHEKVNDTEIKVKPATIVYYDEATGERFEKDFQDKKTISLKTYLYHDSETGRVTKIKYFADDFDDMLRISYAKKYFGTRMYYRENGLDYYEVILSGSETPRFRNLISAAHGNIDAEELVERILEQNVRFLKSPETLGIRESFIPLVVVMMNGLMGILVLIAYISVDKTNGLIKAYGVSPVKISHYLWSKMLVVLTTSLLSTIVITVPIMRAQPNYPLFLLSVVSITLLSCTIGLMVASFFKDVTSSFGLVVGVMVLLALPALTYILPSFSPTWVKLLPSYYMLEAVKETLLTMTDTSFVLLVNLGMLILGAILFLLSEKRYQKILSI